LGHDALGGRHGKLDHRVEIKTGAATLLHEPPDALFANGAPKPGRGAE
jgi:hypothetical protein